VAVQNLALMTFNRGIVSRLALGRLDLERTRLSAEVMTNWMPRILGCMSIRVGMQHLGSTKSNAAARFIPFIFSTTDIAKLELTNLLMRVWVSDALISRVAVSSAVANGNFDSDLTSWTDNDEAGGTSAWVTGGYMGLTGNGTAAAIRDQTVTVSGADISTEHALRIVIERGPVTLRVGSTAGGDEYISETELQTGTHSLAFTPTGNFRIRFLSRLKRQVLVDSCNVEAAGTMEITAPWVAADLGKIRHDQSGDVVFAACTGYRQRRIERRATRSWSVVQYFANDGPLRVENIGPITMTPGALSGNTTLTASASYFKSTNVGSLFRVSSNGQTVTASVTAQNQFTDAIRVEGVDNQRVFTVTVDEDAAGAATFTLQRSLVSDAGPWTDVASYTADTTVAFDDGLDNQLAWYRLGVKTGDYVNGTHTVTLNYTVGSITGFCRVTEFTSATVVNIEVITDFGGTAATELWAEGDWSDRRGFPSAVAFAEGRLWWAGKDKFWGSVSDAFDSHDPEVEGDSGPINRSIGSGPVDNINWLLPLQRLIGGGDGAEHSARSSSLDEIMTPTNFNLKAATTQGSAAVSPIKIDSAGIFVQKNGTRVFELSFANDRSAIDYGGVDLTQLVPEVGEPSIVRSAAQRQPDTRIHFVRSDGTAAVLIFDRTENTVCWCEIETDGLIEDVVIMPAAIEDRVYYVVNRTINGATKRYLEKWALQSECLGSTLCKLADAFVVYSGVSTTVITGLDHLEGEEVVVWADGEDVGTNQSTGSTWTHLYTVSGGQITLAEAASNVVVGLPYRSRWKNSKLAIAAALGASLTMPKKVNGLGLVLADVHAGGLFFGPSFDTLDPLPMVRAGKIIDADTVATELDDYGNVFPGEWSSDARVCLEARAPRPVTVLAMVAETTMNERHP